MKHGQGSLQDQFWSNFITKNLISVALDTVLPDVSMYFPIEKKRLFLNLKKKKKIKCKLPAWIVYNFVLEEFLLKPLK